MVTREKDGYSRFFDHVLPLSHIQFFHPRTDRSRRFGLQHLAAVILLRLLLFFFIFVFRTANSHTETQWIENEKPIIHAACWCCLHVYRPQSHTRRPHTQQIFSSGETSRLARRSTPSFQTTSNVRMDKLVSPWTALRQRYAVQMAPIVLR